MKRTLYLIAIALIAVVAKADLGVGDWRMHPTFGSNYTGLVETADRVYYASSNAVYCYDKKEGTTTDYTVRTASTACQSRAYTTTSTTNSLP